MSNPFGGFMPSTEPEVMDGEFEEVPPVGEPAVHPVSPAGVAKPVPVDNSDTVLEVEAVLDDEAVEYRQQLGLISPVMLSRILGVHIDTLKDWRRAGKGPNYLKIGKKVWYTYAFLLEWLPTRRVRVSTKVEDTEDDTEKGLQQNERPEGTAGPTADTGPGDTAEGPGAVTAD